MKIILFVSAVVVLMASTSPSTTAGAFELSSTNDYHGHVPTVKVRKHRRTFSRKNLASEKDLILLLLCIRNNNDDTTYLPTDH